MVVLVPARVRAASARRRLQDRLRHAARQCGLPLRRARGLLYAKSALFPRELRCDNRHTHASTKLDAWRTSGMTGRELMRILRQWNCEVVRQRGSHVRVRCGKCQTTVPVHAGEDLPRGTLRAIAARSGAMPGKEVAVVRRYPSRSRAGRVGRVARDGAQGTRLPYAWAESRGGKAPRFGWP